MRFLVIFHHGDASGATRPTVLEHLRALESVGSEHEVVYHNTFDELADWTRINPDALPPPPPIASERFDATILHYTFLSMRGLGLPFYRWRKAVAWIGGLSGVKVAIPQDEGFLAGALDDWLVELGVSLIFSVHHRPERPLYPVARHRTRIVSCFPGYIDEPSVERMANRLLPLSERPHDLVYRARNLPFRIGRHGQEKHRIAERVRGPAEERGLVCDISTAPEDVIHGAEWLDFLATSRAVLGVEGGYSAIDWYGEIDGQISRLLRDDPELDFDAVDAQLPEGWDSHDLFTITPRHFEAIVTRTPQILLEGEYRGVLVPDVHYLPLSRDGSNLDEVLNALGDLSRLEEIADRAFDDVYVRGHHTYRDFARRIEAEIRHVASAEEISVNREERAADEGPERDESNESIRALERQMALQRQHDAAMAEQLVAFQYDLPRVLHVAMMASAETIFGASRTEMLLTNVVQKLRPDASRRDPAGKKLTLALAALSAALAFVAGAAVGWILATR